jgi:hypothetical protein
MIQTPYSLDMLELEERQANTLRLVVADSIPRDEREIELIEGVKITGRPTTVGKDSRVFEFVWENYVTYCVTNETYALPDEQLPGEQKRSSGDRIREDASSAFLEFIATWARNEHPGPLRHWCICCNWQIIDVVSWLAPKITQIAGPGAGTTTSA